MLNINSKYSLLSLPLLAVGCAGQKAPENTQPNIVYIIADDMGYGDLGCYGQQYIKTPNIDKLAAEGMQFMQHYAGCPVSAPSRSSLMTGLHTGHTPIRGNKEVMPEGQEPLPAGTLTLPRMLQEAGYRTGLFGKWGLGYPHSEGCATNQGVDNFFGFNCQRLAHNYYPYYLWENNDTVWLDGNKGTGREQYAQDIIHNKGLDFIRQNKDKPFFAMLTYVIPHAELINPQDSILSAYNGQFEEKPFKGDDEDSPYYKIGGYASTEHPRADFAAMITRLDAYVGEIIATLKAEGLDKNTLVIFTSDNGPHREGGADPDFFNSYGPYRGVKRDMYEGGIRIPMIAWMPKNIKAGSKTEHVSAFWDVMPTLAELTGAKALPTTDGISFLPTLFGKDKEQAQHEHLYWEFHEEGGKVAVRKGDWKAIWLNTNNPENTRVELYNIPQDIHEDNNLAEEHPEIVEDLLNIARAQHINAEAFPFTMP